MQYTIIICVFSIGISVPLFMELAFGDAFSDIPVHVSLILKFIHTGAFPNYSIYYIVIYFLSFMSNDFARLLKTAVCFLSFMVLVKALISYNILYKDTNNLKASALVSILLILVSPIINWWNFPYIYIGQLSPTVWHNSTTILNIPFSILLFYYSINTLMSSQYKNIITISVLILLCAITKPNYLLSFLPVYFTCVCYMGLKENIYKLLPKLAIVFIPILSILILQYTGTFNGNSVSSAIAVNPFGVWELYSSNIPMSMLVSIAFPLLFSVLFFEQIKNEPEILLSWAIFIIAVTEFAIFAEVGKHFSAGNIGWACNISLYILFLSCISKLIKQPITKKYYLAASVFLFHVISGMFYYHRIVTGLGYF